MFFPEACISSGHQHSRRKESATTEGLFAMSQIQVCLGIFKGAWAASIIIWLFRWWSWGTKAATMNKESPSYSRRFKLEQWKIFFFMFHIKFSETLYILWLRNKIKHSQKQIGSCLWKNPTTLHKIFKSMQEKVCYWNWQSYT